MGEKDAHDVPSALDPEVRGRVLNVIRKLGAEFEQTLLTVTRQMGFAKEVTDRA
jgi:polar amino acid transport system ATP-binding protein